MGLRLIIETADIQENQYTIKVYLEGYSGTAVTRQATADPFNIICGDEKSKDLPLVYGTQADISFYAETDFEFIDIYQASNNDVLIEIYDASDNLLFKGFKDETQYSEPLLAPPFECSLTAFCGLGKLADEPFLDANGAKYSGLYTIVELLSLILSKTGLELPINTAVNIRESTQVTGADPLTQYRKQVTAYAGLNCFEILEQVFQNCRIMQRSGQWWIISNDNFSKTTISYYSYNATGTFQNTGSFNPVTGQVWEQVEGTRNIIEAIRQLNIKQDYLFVQNIIPNSEFSTIGESGFENWTATNVTAIRRIYNEDGNTWVQINGGELVDPPATGAHTQYLVSSQIPVEATDFVSKFSAKFGIIGDRTRSAKLYFGIRLVGDGSEYWLDCWLDTEENDYKIHYDWKAGSTKTGVPVLPYRESSRDTSTRWNPFDWESHLQNENITGSPITEALANLKKLSISIEGGIPVSGYIEIYLYPPNFDPSTNRGGARVIGSAWTDLILNFESDEDTDTYDVEKTQHITIINSEKNRYIPDDIELVNGDLPDIPAALTIYNGSFIKSDGAKTKLWIIDGITGGPYNYAELIGRMKVSSLRRPKEQYTITIANYTLGLDIVVSDAQNNNKKFVECGVTFSPRMRQIQGTYVEVMPDDIQYFTIRKTSNNQSDSADRSTANGETAKTTITNTDEKVGFIDTEKKYTKVYSPGYLDFRFFEPIYNTEEDDNTEGSATAAIRPVIHLIHENWKINESHFKAIASGKNSIAIGEGTQTKSFREIAIGSFNKTVGPYSAEVWNLFDLIISVGIGTGENDKKNAIEVYKSGMIKLFNALQLGPTNNIISSPGMIEFSEDEKFKAFFEGLWNEFLFLNHTIAVCQGEQAGVNIYFPPEIPGSLLVYDSIKLFEEQLIKWND